MVSDRPFTTREYEGGPHTVGLLDLSSVTSPRIVRATLAVPGFIVRKLNVDDDRPPGTNIRFCMTGPWLKGSSTGEPLT